MSHFKRLARVSQVVFISVFVSLAAHAAKPTEDDLFSRYRRIQLGSPSTKDVLNAAERLRVFTDTANDPVASLDVLDRYDPKGFVGFCFGRAMTAHLIARKAGLRYESIGKLFVIGDLRSGSEPEWRFHVTTVVKGEDGKSYAIDPIMTPPLASGGPLLVEEWIRIVKKTWDRAGKASFYFTEADVIFPDITADADGTSGEKIIELGFDAKKHPGFQALKAGEHAIYSVSRAAAQQFFIGNLTEDPAARFRFLGIRIPSLAQLGISPDVDYNGYFASLLTELGNPAAAAALRVTPLGAVPHCVRCLAVPANPKRSLHSMRLGHP